MKKRLMVGLMAGGLVAAMLPGVASAGGPSYWMIVPENTLLCQTQIVKDPTMFDVLLLDNFYGDILSDLCAGLVGGLGVVPGANFGEDCAVFESVHGSAPDIAGQGLANPLAAIMSGVMMLNHLGESAAAERIKRAYNEVLSSQDPSLRTADIGGTASTDGFAEALIRLM